MSKNLEFYEDGSTKHIEEKLGHYFQKSSHEKKAMEQICNKLDDAIAIICECKHCVKVSSAVETAKTKPKEAIAERCQKLYPNKPKKQQSITGYAKSMKRCKNRLMLPRTKTA